MVLATEEWLDISDELIYVRHEKAISRTTESLMDPPGADPNAIADMTCIA
jgi:hypothetical protein